MGEKARELSLDEQLADDQAHYALALERRRHARTPIGRALGSLQLRYYNYFINEDVDAIEAADYRMRATFPEQSPPPEQEQLA